MDVKKQENNQKGMTILELMIVLVIFSVVMAGLYSSYQTMMRQGVKEFRIAQSEMETNISANIIKRDMNLAGYGLADNYNGLFTAVSATVGGGISQNSTTKGYPSTLTLMGTALGIQSGAAQHWTYISDYSGGVASFATWTDVREDVKNNDVVILMDPSTKTLLTQGADWKFIFNGSGNPLTTLASTPLSLTTGNKGYLLYGIYRLGDSSAATQPFYAVAYSLGGTAPSNCAPNTLNLLRAESSTTSAPSGGSPVMNCVAEFRIAFGLTTAGSADSSVGLPIDFWDNTGAVANLYSPTDLKKRLKQIRAYLLIQEGSYDSGYTYKNPDTTPGYFGTQTIRVGDLYMPGGGTGRDYTLQPGQGNYHWRVLSYTATPRNLH